MTYRSEAEINLGVFEKTNVRLTVAVRTPDLHEKLTGTATLVISTGSCRMQEYPTAEDLRLLARDFLAASVALDAIAAEQAQHEEVA